MTCSQVQVTINGITKSCRGGIFFAYVKEIIEDVFESITSTFMDNLPAECQLMSPNKLQKQIKEFR